MSLRNFSVPKLSFSNRYFLLPIILIVFFLLFYLVYNDIKAKTINEFNNEQLIVAQASSQGIASFFQNYQNELTFLSQNKWIIDFNDDTKALMESFYNNHKNLIEAVTRVDAHGKILYTYPFKKSVIGEDISYQKHVHQVLTTHQPVISDVFMSVQGYLAVALHVPVFKGQEFKGSLAILIQIDKLGKIYFEKIKIRGTYNTWLLSENGIEIFGQIKEHKGKSLLEITHNDPLATQLLDKLKKEDKGTTKSIHPERGADGQTKFIEQYIAFYRVPLGDTYWTILISYNEDEIYATLNSFRNRLIVIFSFLFIVMAYYFYSFTKVRTVLKEETKRKEAEKTLRESEEIFRHFMEYSPIYIFFKDENLRSLRLSKNYETMLGKPLSELLGKNMDELFPSDLAKSMVEDDKRILKEGKEIIVEEEYNERFYSTIKFPIFINGIARFLAGYTIDITDRKIAEEASQMWGNVFRNAGWGVSVSSKNGKYLEMMNPRFAEMHGYTVDELKGQSILNLYPPNIQEDFLKQVNIAYQKGNHLFESSHLRKDGTSFPVIIDVTVVKDPDSDAFYQIVNVQDITERKRTEEALQESEIRMRDIIFSVGEWVWEVDQDGRYSYSSKKGEDFLGYSLEEIIGKTPFDFMPTDEAERIKNVFFEIISQKAPIKDLENWNLRKNGEKICLVTNGVPIIDEMGNLKGYRGVDKDITKRKLAEDALRESELKFRAVIEEAVEIVFTLDNQGYFTYVNPAGVKSSGYSLDELIKLKYIDLIEPDYKQRVNFTYYRQYLKRKSFTTTEYPFRTKIGEIKWFNQNTRLIIENGEIRGFYVIARDVTERRKAEEAMRESEEKFRNLVESINEVFYIADKAGRITYCSPNITLAMGFTLKEILGNSFLRLIAPIDRRSVLDHYLNMAIKGETDVMHEFRVRGKDGKIIWAEQITHILRDASGSVIEYRNVTRNITDRKKVEEEFKKVSRAVEQSPVSVIITNKEGDIEYVNEKFCEVTGYSREEVISKNPSILNSGYHDKDFYSNFWATILEGENWEGEMRNKKKNGELYWESVLVSPILNSERSITHFVAIKEDITEKKMILEELIEAKEKAELSNKLKDAFIANMSHEIRTPLNGILGLSSIIKNLYAEHIKEEDESIFAGIDHSSKRIIRTVDMILNYSRIQTGEFPISPIEIELSLICENLTKEFAIKAKSKLLEFSFENRCGKDITVFGDEYSITHSISNLLDNAIKYTEKGSIEIILYYGNKDEIMLDIKDSGIGISKDYLSHVFEPYQQEHLGYGRAYEGVGLGLSMVKKFLDLNKAEIFVTSEKGKGSTFTIRFGKALPTSEKEVIEKKIDKSITGQTTGNRPLILLVEDDVFNQAAIKMFIEKAYDTIITDSSEGALDIMSNNRVDLILMDISIKGSKNGLELTKEFKASKEYAHIPIIAITAHAFESDKHNALKAGCDDYLSKPFSKELLQKIIGKFV